MIPPKDHANEEKRLASLDSYSIMDTLPEEDYDNLTTIAAEICGTPISLVSLLDSDRQWFKSRFGLDAPETPKEYAFCGHAINESDDVFIIQDSRLDERFHDNPLVVGDPRVIFYAGVPLCNDEGLPLGTLCVIDHKPKLLSQNQINCLKALANQVMRLLQLRKTNAQLKKSIEDLDEKNGELEQFAYIAAHDLKSPLNNILGSATILSEGYSKSLDDDGKAMISFIQSASETLKGLIDGLLEYSRSETVLKEEKSKIDLQLLCNDIHGLFCYDNSVSINVKSDLESITLNRTAIDQILINLVGNAIKYSDKEDVKIEFGVSEESDSYQFYVKDNGPGISKEHQNSIFQIFKTLKGSDKFGRKGNGIGLATVKKIVGKMGGTIRVESDPPNGASFIFNIKKEMETSLVSAQV
ncbi:MAG: GAF domain-containing sensor histidine kinase [Eudoraea sp.]|nr:GAF domain-containing sensor histidine kinase [Eudoraea sp.]